jgi:hypothetical protein
VIDDLSKTLRSILQQAAVPRPLKDVHIVFDQPTEKFDPSEPTIDLFLYDIRENTELRSNEPMIQRQNGEAKMFHPPCRVACSYLLTAWPKGAGELPLVEHQLLSQALMVLKRYPTIPESFLQGNLKGQAPPLPMMITQADGLKNPHEFWTAIGNKLRPSITVSVTIGMEVSEPAPEEVALVTLHDIRLGERTSATEQAINPATFQGPFTVTGRITAADGKPAAGVNVTLVEADRSAQTDADGRYLLRQVLPGGYTLRIETAGIQPQEVKTTIPAPRGKSYNVQLS